MKRGTKTLALRGETIRALTEGNLTVVAGGAPRPTTSDACTAQTCISNWPAPSACPSCQNECG